MGTDPVRVWRAAETGPVLLMAGQTTHYAIEPRGEYVFGIVAGKPMRSRRGRERRLIEPGQVVAWDPSNAHAGAAVDGQPWTSRLIIVEIADLATLANDQESALLADIAFPEPAYLTAELARDFLQMHRALEAPSTRLERDQRLAEWLRALIERSSAVRPLRSPLSPHDDRALHLAYDYLARPAGAERRPRRARRRRRHREVPPHPPLPRAHRSTTPRTAGRPPHPQGPPTARSRRDDRRRRRRHRLRRPKSPAPPLPTQPRADTRRVSTKLQPLSPRLMCRREEVTRADSLACRMRTGKRSGGG